MSQATNIILNMEAKVVHQAKLPYAQLVHLAYPEDPPADQSDIRYTVTVAYADGSGEFSLTKTSKPVDVKEGMVCNVRKTGRS